MERRSLFLSPNKHFNIYSFPDYQNELTKGARQAAGRSAMQLCLDSLETGELSR
jgi:hypothetical protein